MSREIILEEEIMSLINRESPDDIKLSKAKEIKNDIVTMLISAYTARELIRGDIPEDSE